MDQILEECLSDVEFPYQFEDDAQRERVALMLASCRVKRGEMTSDEFAELNMAHIRRTFDDEMAELLQLRKDLGEIEGTAAYLGQDRNFKAFLYVKDLKEKLPEVA